MKTLRLLLLSILSFCFMNAFADTQAGSSTPHPIEFSKPVKEFIQQMVKQYHFNHDSLVQLFRKAQYDPKIIKKITSPYEQKPWSVYRTYFITPKRIEGGVAYWNEHQKTLQSVFQRYGVDPSVIVAIIGIETNYGSHKGEFSALNALATLSFYYPPRETFFKRELTNLLLLAREQHARPTHIKSSYAGAIGIPQFMPSTYRHYALSYKKNQPINLSANNNDAIISVANYLYKNGWQKGKPVATSAVSYQPPKPTLVSKNAKPNTTVGALEKQGIHPEASFPPSTKVALIDLDNKKDQNEYWFVFENFKAIMSYNPRINYAMAVYQLSRAIREAHERNGKSLT